MTKLYTVLPDFDWVAGQPTPKNRQVALTDIEAAFDLSLERIALAPETVAEPEAAASGTPTDGAEPVLRGRK